MTESIIYCPEYITEEAMLPLEVAETYIPPQFTHRFDLRCPTPKELAAYVLLDRFVPGEKNDNKIKGAAYFMALNLRSGLDNKDMSNAWTFIAAHVLDPRRDTPMNSLEAFIDHCNRENLVYDETDTSLLSQEFIIKASKKYFYLRPNHIDFGMTEQERLVGGF